MQDQTHIDFDVEKIRRDFPALHQQVYGKPLVYLDNGASAQKSQAVIDTIVQVYSHDYANVHRGLHYLSNKATDSYEKAREQVRAFLNAEKADEIVFTKNATEAINTVAYGWGMPNIGEGDEIVLTIMEHHSNLVPWHFIRERQGAKLVFVPVDEDGVLHMEAFEKALSSKTKLVAITHMSNMLGTILPVKEMIQAAHDRDIPVLVDGSQAAVHLPVDVRDLNADWYVFTGHKIYGPTGIGVLYGRQNMLEAMRPFQGGGEMIDTVSTDHISYNAPPHRFEAGTPPIVQAIGLGAALDYINQTGREAIYHYEQQLTRYAQEQLQNIDGLTLYGKAAEKGAIFSFNVDTIHAHDVAMFIDRQGIAVRAGTHCTQPLLDFYGVSATCRASFAMYNTFAEVDALVLALDKARTFFND